ncbi:hypothetical protein A3Q56_05799 [Intoshia linei]|uniref:Cadherin domain-containing protein n=1 Tax=Intoshia linei TaxID=1819745 RepID=A0A177AY90_9BILA|nr:hypothetical protein A3Q56_05799 [Intoshia linei]
MVHFYNQNTQNIQFVDIAMFLFLFLFQPIVAETCQIFGNPSNHLFIENIPESTKIGSVIGHVDISGKNNEMELNQVKGNSTIIFNSIEKSLTLASALDRESYSRLRVEILCRPLTTFGEFKIIVDIIVSDSNDNRPKFSKEIYEITISELTLPNTVIINDIIATDSDEDNAFVQYTLGDGKYSEYLSIPNKYVGEAVLTKMVDYEKIKYMSFIIIATDSPFDETEKRYQSTAELIVHIKNIDDVNPIFNSNHYHSVMPLGFKPYEKLKVYPQISAYDGDKDMNEAINYKILDYSNSDKYFTIHPKTGEITLIKSIDTTIDYNLFVRAFQNNDETKYSDAIVSVTTYLKQNTTLWLLKNDYHVNLAENSKIGTYVTTIEGFPKNMINFKIVNDTNYFVIDTESGVITVNDVIDYEKITFISFKVLAELKKQKELITVRVDVINENDNNPYFTVKDYNLYMDVPKLKLGMNNTIFTISALDQDSKSNVTYSLDGPQNFKIDKISGKITYFYIKNQTELIDNRIFTLLVHAHDNGVPPRTTMTLVPVKIINGHKKDDTLNPRNMSITGIRVANKGKRFGNEIIDMSMNQDGNSHILLESNNKYLLIFLFSLSFVLFLFIITVVIIVIKKRNQRKMSSLEILREMAYGNSVDCTSSGIHSDASPSQKVPLDKNPFMFHVTHKNNNSPKTISDVSYHGTMYDTESLKDSLYKCEIDKNIKEYYNKRNFALYRTLPFYSNMKPQETNDKLNLTNDIEVSPHKPLSYTSSYFTSPQFSSETNEPQYEPIRDSEDLVKTRNLKSPATQYFENFERGNTFSPSNLYAQSTKIKIPTENLSNIRLPSPKRLEHNRLPSSKF